MKIVITDANIFMHLIDSGLPGSFFRLELEICTTEEVFIEIGEERHLLEPFIGKQLEIITSKEDELVSLDYTPLASGLSFPDRTVLFHAMRLKGIVLTGEALMRKECERLGLEVHGVLWVLDRLKDSGICDRNQLTKSLTYLMSLPDFRVPRKECELLLRKWEVDPEQE